MFDFFNRVPILVAVAILCSGCESPTQLYASGSAGKLYYVAFKGPGDKLTQGLYAETMLRAAQIAQAQGKPYFLMYESLDSAAQNIPTRLPRAGSINGLAVTSVFILLLDQPAPAARSTTAVLAEFGAEAHAGAAQ